MPLDKKTRKKVIDYVLRDVVPKTVTPRPSVPFDWFVQQFSFIPDENLRNHLGEAFYQARYVGRVREALDLRSGFNHAFTKYQIVLYASIYEAVIDYMLEYCSGKPEVKALLTEVVLKEQANSLSSKAKLIYSTDSEDIELIPCRKEQRTRQLREVQFDKRVDAAVKLGIVKEPHAAFIKKLYKNRNNVHLQASANKSFSPDDQESSDAFRMMFDFIEGVSQFKNSGA